MSQTSTINNAPLSRTEAADYLMNRCGRYTGRSLADLASKGGGPRYRMWAGRAVYEREDLDSWLASRIRPPAAAKARAEFTETPAAAAAA